MGRKRCKYIKNLRAFMLGPVLVSSSVMMLIPSSVQSNSLEYLIKVSGNGSTVIRKNRDLYEQEKAKQEKANREKTWLLGNVISSDGKDPVVNLDAKQGSVLNTFASRSKPLSDDELFTQTLDQEAALSAAVASVLGTKIRKKRRRKGVEEPVYRSTFGDVEPGNDSDLKQMGLFGGAGFSLGGSAGVFSNSEANRLSDVGKGITALSDDARAPLPVVGRTEDLEKQDKAPQLFLDELRSERKKMFKKGDALFASKPNAAGVTSSNDGVVDPDTLWLGGKNRSMRKSPASGSVFRFDATPLFATRGRGVDKGFSRSFEGASRPSMKRFQ